VTVLSTADKERDIAPWVVFGLDQWRYALPLAAVQRVVRAAQYTPLPLAPDVVLGALDVEGEIYPVFDLRRRFHLPQRAVQADDQFLIARTARRSVVLAIDSAHGVIEPSSPVTEAARVAPQLAQVRGIMALEDGLVLIQDLEQFLSADETQALDRALSARETQNGA